MAGYIQPCQTNSAVLKVVRDLPLVERSLS